MKTNDNQNRPDHSDKDMLHEIIPNNSLREKVGYIVAELYLKRHGVKPLKREWNGMTVNIIPNTDHDLIWIALTQLKKTQEKQGEENRLLKQRAIDLHNKKHPSDEITKQTMHDGIIRLFSQGRRVGSYKPVETKTGSILIAVKEEEATQ